MGSPLSPVISDLVLQNLEEYALKKLPFTPLFYFRYVDDIATAAPPVYFDTMLAVSNSFHDRLNFTIEIGRDDVLNFLDVSLVMINGSITYNWYHKPTFSGRYLNCFSQHHISQKRAVALAFIDRAFLLSHPSFHQENLHLVISILLNNGYPLRLIFCGCLTG